VNAAISPFFRNHVNYSALLICIFPLLVVFIKNTSGARKGFLISLLIITLFAVYLSYARGAWLALFVGLLGYWLLKKKLLLPAFVLSLILLISSVLFLRQNDRYLRFAPDYKSTVFHTDFTEHMAATYSMQDLSTAERYYRWIAGIKMVADSWLTGFGPNTFYNNYKSYTAPAFKTWVSKNEEHSTVHNYFLLLLAEQGVIALLLFLMTLGSFFWYAQKIYARTEDVFWKAAVAVVAVIVCMIATVNMLSDLIETDKVGSMFYLCIAVLIIADLKTKELLKNTVAQSAE
jgi:O-antigen ligase